MIKLVFGIPDKYLFINTSLIVSEVLVRPTTERSPLLIKPGERPQLVPVWEMPTKRTDSWSASVFFVTFEKRLIVVNQLLCEK